MRVRTQISSLSLSALVADIKAPACEVRARGVLCSRRLSPSSEYIYIYTCIQEGEREGEAREDKSLFFCAGVV